MYTLGRKVLVVDSSATTLACVKTELVLRGFQVRTTQNPNLEQVVEQFKPDMVLLGAGLCRPEPPAVALEELRRNSHPRMAVYIHAHHSDADVETLVATSGADGYFRRASDMDAFADRIESILSARGQELE